MYMSEGVPGDRRAIIVPVGDLGIILSDGKVLTPYLKEYKKGTIFSKSRSEVYYPKYVSIQEYTQGAEGKFFWRTLLNFDINEWEALDWEYKKDYFNIGRQENQTEEEPQIIEDEENLDINLMERISDYENQTLDLESFERELPQPDSDYYVNED